MGVCSVDIILLSLIWKIVTQLKNKAEAALPKSAQQTQHLCVMKMC